MNKSELQKKMTAYRNKLIIGFLTDLRKENPKATTWSLIVTLSKGIAMEPEKIRNIVYLCSAGTALAPASNAREKGHLDKKGLLIPRPYELNDKKIAAWV